MKSIDKRTLPIIPLSSAIHKGKIEVHIPDVDRKQTRVKCDLPQATSPLNKIFY